MHEVRFGPQADRASGGLIARFGVAILVVALLGAGLVAVQSFGSSGGADRPEDAVASFLESVGNEDFLGAAELVDPSERRSLVEPAIEMTEELKRLDVLADDFDLGSVGGVDLEFIDLTYRPEPVGADVVRVAVDGTVTASGDLDAVRLGDLVTRNVPEEVMNEARADMAMVSTESLDDVGIVAVQRDSRWYVSLWYSVAELARREAGEPAPRWGEGPTPIGGDTPEAAVRGLVDRAVDLDLAGVIGHLDPEEMAVLYDYSTLFLDDADAAVAEFLADTPDFQVSIDRLDLRSEIDGDDAVVWVDSLAVSVSGDGDRVVIDTDAECIVFANDEWNPGGECVVDRGDLDAGSAELALDLDVMPSPSVRLKRTGDRWYLSPTASVMVPTLEFMRALDTDQLQRWIDDPDQILEEYPDVLAEAPASAGLVVVAVGAAVLLGRSLEAQFSGISEAPFENAAPGTALELSIPGESFEPRPLVPELQAELTITVYVVIDDVPAGEVVVGGGAMFVRATSMPPRLVPQGAVTDLDLVTGLVAREDIAANQVLVFDMLSETAVEVP